MMEYGLEEEEEEERGNRGGGGGAGFRAALAGGVAGVLPLGVRQAAAAAAGVEPGEPRFKSPPLSLSRPLRADLGPELDLP